MHVEIPHFHALFEGAVDWRACSAVAAEVASAALDGRTPDVGLAKKEWAGMIAARQCDFAANGQPSGAQLKHIHWSLQQRGYEHLDWIDYDPARQADIHQLLKDACAAGDPVIILLTNGQALPDNERGVEGHFVCLGGIDSTSGYLVANGDTQTAIRTRATWPPLNWATWGQLVAAGVAGAIRVYPKAVAPTPTPTPTPVPVAAPTTPPQVAQALAAVEQASQALATAEAALKAL